MRNGAALFRPKKEQVVFTEVFRGTYEYAWGGETMGVSFAKTQDGDIYYCGHKMLHNGQSVIGDAEDTTIFKKHPFGMDQVSYGGSQGLYSLAIKNGELYSTGNNNWGQLGLGDKTHQVVYTRVGTFSDWVYVKAGVYEAFGIRSNGDMYAWGRNLSGVLGLGDEDERLTPTLIDYLSGWTHVGSCQRWQHAAWGICNGKLYVTGLHYYGTSTFVQQQLDLEDWTDLDASNRHHFYALRGDGELYTWGLNNNNSWHLGHTGPDSLQPVRLGTDSNWQKIACGYSFHGVAIKGGQLMVTGQNNRGALGMGTTTPIAGFTAVSGFDNCTSVATGGDWSSVIHNGELYSTGTNGWGQLGLGDITQRNVFTKVTQVG